jgi:UDP-glucose 4-epimerase
MSDLIDRAVLVTGGAGFIGSHLVETLVRRRARVTVADNVSSGCLSNLASVQNCIDFRKVDLVHDDVTLLLREQRFEAVFHLAGHATISDSVKQPRLDFENNLLGTFNLLESIRHALPGARVLFASSAAVYGEGSDQPFHETDPLVPRSPYGVAKLAAERYMHVYASVYGLRTAILRLFPVYGPRQRSLVMYDLMRKIVENPHELFIHGDGSQVRDFVHVTDVAEAFVAVAEKGPLNGEVYNVATGKPVSIRGVAQMICTRMKVSPRFVFGGELQPGVSGRWSADISHLKHLGYQPRTTLDDGLTRTIAWFREDTAPVRLG